MSRYNKPRYIDRAYQQIKADAVARAAAPVTPHPKLEILLRDRYHYLLPAYQRGELAHDTVQQLVRDLMFLPFDVACVEGKFRRITSKDMPHVRDCRWNDLHTRYESTLMQPQGNWPALELAREQCASIVIGYGPEGQPILSEATTRYEIRSHVATCPCGKQRHRLSAHVEICFAGFTLTREYAVPTPQPENTP